MQLSPWTSTSNLTQTPRARKKLGKQSKDGSWQFTFDDNSTYGSQDSLGTNKKKKNQRQNRADTFGRSPSNAGDVRAREDNERKQGHNTVPATGWDRKLQQRSR